MMHLDINLYTPDFVQKLQAKVQCDMLAGVQLTEFISEGTQLRGLAAYTIEEILRAIEIYWDERNGEYITETQTDYSGYFTINPQQFLN